MSKQLGFIAVIISASASASDSAMGLVGTFGPLSTPFDPATGTKYIIGDFLATGRMLTGMVGMLVINT